MKKLISIVIPVYNEQEVIDELRKRLLGVMDSLTSYDFEVLLVENGSHDASYQMLTAMNNEDPRFKVLRLSRNFGCDGGIIAGLHYARGDAAVIMNADLQDPPEMISEFIDKWNEGYDVVYGVIQERQGVSFIRRTLSSIAYKIIYYSTKKTLPENVSDFRLADKKVYSAVNGMEEKNKYLRGIFAWTGFRQTGIRYNRPPRFAGEPKANYLTVFKVAMNGMFSFSYYPLYAAAILGFIVSFLSVLFLLMEIGLYLYFGQAVPGFTTMMISMLFLFSMLFMLLGIIGIYLARIYEEVKQRPNYIVRETIGLSE